MKLIKLQSAIMTLLILTALFSAVTVHAAGGTYTAEFSVTTLNPKKKHSRRNPIHAENRGTATRSASGSVGNRRRAKRHIYV